MPADEQHVATLTWAAKAAAGCVCVVALMWLWLLAPRDNPTRPWFALFFLFSALSAGFGVALEVSLLWSAGATDALNYAMLICLELAALGAWTAGSNMLIAACTDDSSPPDRHRRYHRSALAAGCLLCLAAVGAVLGAPAADRFDAAFVAASFGAVGLIAGALGCAIRRTGSTRAAACLILAGVVATGLGFVASSCIPASTLPHGVEPDGIFHLSLTVGQLLIFAGVVIYHLADERATAAAQEDCSLQYLPSGGHSVSLLPAPTAGT